MSVILLGACTALSWFSERSFGHDIALPEIDQDPAATISQSEAAGETSITKQSAANEPGINQALGEKDLDLTIQSIIDLKKRWKTGSKVTFCFGGIADDITEDRRQRFIAAANSWLVGTSDGQKPNLKFLFIEQASSSDCDCADLASPVPCNIQVIFKAGPEAENAAFIEQGTGPGALASRGIIWIGYECSGANCSPLSEQTKVDFDQRARHEVGHALGLMHEHRHPEANCFSHIKPEMRDQALEQVDDLNRIIQGPRYRVTEYDPTSIMHYWIDPAYLIDAEQDECYAPTNFIQSDADLTEIANTYPATIEEQNFDMSNRMVIAFNSINRRNELTIAQREQLRGQIIEALGSISIE